MNAGVSNAPWRVVIRPKQRLIREMVLQLKTGALDTGYFQQKFGVDVWNEFRPVYEGLEEKRLLARQNGSIALTRRGLLEVDHFLIDFFEPELRNIRYA
jgi:oxygen-independent coproporphyrinogen-3 oxidase